MTLATIILTGSFGGASGYVTVGPSVQLTDTATGKVIPVTPQVCYLNSAGRFTSTPLRTTDDQSIEPAPGFWSYVITVVLAASPPQSWSVDLPSALGPVADLHTLVPVTSAPQVSPVFPYMPIPAGTPAAGDVPVATGDGAVTQWSASTGFTTAGTGLSGSGTTVSLSAPVSVADGGTGATSAAAALTSLGAASATALTAETSRAQAAEALLAPKASPALTGTPTAPTAAALTASTQVATTAYADAAVTAEAARAETAEALLLPLPTGSPAAGQVPVATGTGAASAWGGTIAMGGHKVTGLANGTASTDAAAFGQIPAALPPSGAAGGDLSGSYPSPSVAKIGGTAFSLPVSVANGGTGAATQQGAINALTGAQSAGTVLRSDGTNATLSAIQASDVPVLNQSTTGTAAGLSSTLAITSGGTGQVTRQAAINALTGSQAAGTVLRSDGTNATLSAIQAADVPVLNQNTTGTAAGLSATLAIGSGGTGQVTQQGAINALAGAQTSGRYLRGDGTNVSMSAIQAADVPTLNQNTTGTAGGLSSTLPVASGGTGQVTQPAALTALAGTQSAGKYLRSDGTNTSLAAIQAGDVPVLNQSTTGTAAGLSTTLALASGGTGQTSAQAAMNALAGAQTSGSYLRGNGTSVVMSAILAADLPAASTSAQGAVQLDGTAGDIQPAGTGTAGSSGKAPDAQHVHPENLWTTPADLGFLAMNYDPGMCTSSTALTAGWVLLSRISIRRALTATNVSFILGANGSGTSAGTFAGIYSSSGTLLSGSSDFASSATSGATKTLTVALTTPQSLSAGTSVYIAVVSNLSTTQPALGRATSIGFFNLAGTPAATARFASYSTGSQTSLPLSISTSTQFSATNSLPVWTAIS